jgi:hypothetical protein
MAAQPEFLVEVLDTARHRREKFTCESPDLTDFLRTRARKETKARASVCFVLVPFEDHGRIAGYYTLSATSIELAKLPDDFTRKLPRPSRNALPSCAVPPSGHLAAS